LASGTQASYGFI